MITRTMFGTVTTTGDNLFTIDMQRPGLLVGVQWALSADSITDNSRAELMLSNQTSSQFATNDVLNIISMICFNSNFVTSGLSQPVVAQFVPVSWPLRATDRLAIHSNVAGTVNVRTYVILWIQ